MQSLAKILGVWYTYYMINLEIFSKKKLCVAVSGGVDSTALLHFLKASEKEYGYILSAVHCEHGIRGAESVADQSFVEELCRAWDVPLFVYREDCIARAAREKCSLETAARNFRYERFSDLVKTGKADFIATAHHKSDAAETVVFRIARGASLSGAAGIREQNEFMIRPFLDWSKEEIIAYAKVNGLEFCVDSTNAELIATRNILRLKVFPVLEEVVPNAIENIARFAELAAEDDEFLYEESEKLLLVEKDGYTVTFCDKKPLFKRACLTAMKALGVDRDYTAAHLEKLFLLQGLERGAKLDMPRGVRAEKTLTGVAFYRQSDEEEMVVSESLPFTGTGFDGGVYAVNVDRTPPKGVDTAWKTLRIDKEKLPKDAVFRFRKEGDWIERFGGGKKTLKKFFNEEKTPVLERAAIPLIASGRSSEVYAVCGVEISERVKVTEDTQCVLYITIKKKEKKE